MIEVELKNIIIDEKRQDQVIVLKEKKGKRQFPIIIGYIEASSIKMKIAGVKPPRPLTHDLLLSLMKGLDAKLEYLFIDKMIDGTFHAKLKIKTKEDQEKFIDTRPSDGIALAVRAGASIFVEEKVLEKAMLFKME
ncbi:MAG TPA: bifunctional nuclease family protein [Candidatus Omnitrophota bacterium]|nr:bifunctional nuclease family protein [Candidatus Omnitrophota bacterium]HPN88389.1 bifunctional nuclease family protein [Candidatus Omnitrophota bacterium]